MYEHSLALFRALEYPFFPSLLVRLLAEVAHRRGEHARAHALYGESLRLCTGLRVMVPRVAGTLKRLAELSEVAGQLERAARLGGASERVLEVSGDPPEAPVDEAYYCEVAEAQARLAAAGCAAAWAEGRAMTLEQAIAYAMEQDTSTG